MEDPVIRPANDVGPEEVMSVLTHETNTVTNSQQKLKKME